MVWFRYLKLDPEIKNVYCWSALCYANWPTEKYYLPTRNSTVVNMKVAEKLQDILSVNVTVAQYVAI